LGRSVFIYYYSLCLFFLSSRSKRVLFSICFLASWFGYLAVLLDTNGDFNQAGTIPRLVDTKKSLPPKFRPASPTDKLGRYYAPFVLGCLPESFVDCTCHSRNRHSFLPTGWNCRRWNSTIDPEEPTETPMLTQDSVSHTSRSCLCASSPQRVAWKGTRVERRWKPAEVLYSRLSRSPNTACSGKPSSLS
jgi:hypothetical protein